MIKSGLGVALTATVAAALWLSTPSQAEAQVDFANKYCYVYVAGYEYYTWHQSVDAVTPCQMYVQGLLDWGCPQLGETGVFTMELYVTQLVRNRPPNQWYLPTNWQCVNGAAERR